MSWSPFSQPMHMLRDLSDAVRMLRRSPGFACAVVALLALGVGANTAVFSVVRAVLLRPLPYKDADRLVYVWLERRDEATRRHGILTGQFILEWKNHNSAFGDVAALRTWETTLQGQMDFFGDDYAERLRGAFATPNFFELLGVAPALGRTFAPDDASGDPVVVLSDGFWRRRFGADPSVIGRSVALMPNRDPRGPRNFTIAGVLPASFRFSYPNATEVWGVLPWQDVRPTPSLEFSMVARLKPGVSLSDAQAEMTAIAQGVVRGSPIPQRAREEVARRTIAWPETLPEHLKSEVRAGLLLIAATAGSSFCSRA